MRDKIPHIVSQDIELCRTPPSVEEYLALRQAVGFTVWPSEAAEKALASSLMSVSLRSTSHGLMVAMGRLIGDGAVVFQVVDVMVRPDWQGRGLGSMVMDELMAWLKQHATPDALVSLLANSGKADYYKHWGFAERPASAPGMSRRI